VRRAAAKDENAVRWPDSADLTRTGIETAAARYQLAYVGVTVVSGGARGIDRRASRRARAKVDFCVLGTGINIDFTGEQRLFGILRRTAPLSRIPFNRNADSNLSPFAPHRRRHALGAVIVKRTPQRCALSRRTLPPNTGDSFACRRLDSPRSRAVTTSQKAQSYGEGRGKIF